MNAPVLHTERLVLRGWTDSDREPFAAMNTDAEVMEFIGPHLTRARVDEWVDDLMVRFDRDGFGLWAVEEAATATFCGFIGLNRATFEATFTPGVEVGWRLARRAWGHGYATEGALAALHFGFETVGLSEIVSFTAATNLRSQAVMERIGMERDRSGDFAHPNAPVGSGLEPHVLYRISRSGTSQQD